MTSKPSAYSMSCSSELLQDVYCEHSSWLTGWLAKTLGCPHNAADLSQDTFERVMTRTDLSAVNDYRPWLLTIAKRLLIDKTRRQKLEQAYLEALQLSGVSAETEASSEQIWIAVQMLEQISLALDTLAEKPRQAFILRHIEGHTQAYIAEQLGVSMTMVRNYLVQGLVACYRVVEDLPELTNRKS